MAAAGPADLVPVSPDPARHPAGPAGEGATPLERLAAEVVALASELFAVEARFLVALAEFDRRDGWAGVGMRSCAHWLNWRCGIDLHTARERVRVARRLEQLPRVAQSFTRGEVSYSKVRAMTRVATPENEQVLLDAALAGTASQVERIVRATRRAEQDVQLESDLRAREGLAEPDPLAGVLTRRFLPDGRVELRLVLDAEDAQIVLGALHAVIAAEQPPTPDPPGTDPGTDPGADPDTEGARRSAGQGGAAGADVPAGTPQGRAVPEGTPQGRAVPEGEPVAGRPPGPTSATRCTCTSTPRFSPDAWTPTCCPGRRSRTGRCFRWPRCAASPATP